MNETTRPRRKISEYVITGIAFAIYIWVFAGFQARYGLILTSLAIFPVILGSWYFGVSGGIVTTILSIFSDIGSLLMISNSPVELLESREYIIGNLILFFVALIVGRMSTLLRQHNSALVRLELIETERRTHLNFLEFLNRITGTALESEELDLTMRVLVDQIAGLFKADDCFFARWDEASSLTIPMMAYGSLRDAYPNMRFEAGEITLTSSILERGRPLAIADTKNSPHISPEIAARFPGKSMLGIPLIAQNRKLGALILGYNESRSFDPQEISRAEIAAEQIALVLLKSQLLEEAHRQVAELTTIHDAALAIIQADGEDQLIERVTEIVGANLFPDNFGVMLLDQRDNVLRAHSSYRFYSDEKMIMRVIPLTEGVTGEVARTGLPRRIGDVRKASEYVDIDHRTRSELCVPLKFQEQILGVINAESIKENAFTAEDERLMVTLAGQMATAIEQLRKARAERNWLDQLAHSNALIYAIAQITSRLETRLTMEEIIQRLGAELQKIDLTCIMAIHDPERDTFTINYTSLPPEHLSIVDKGLGYPMLHYTFPGGNLTKNSLEPAAISKPEDEIEALFTDTEKPGVLRILREIGITPGMEPLRLPLIVEDALLGVLWIWGRDIRRSDLPILSIFAKQVGVSLERARLFQKVQNLAITDPLTGLHNRRSSFDLGRIEFSRGQRLNRPFCSMMLDIDHFKQINDRYGHAAGDQILQEFAKLCQRSVREIDLIGRYGGEEIIILLPETELDVALHVAERLRANVAGSMLNISGREINITVSIGVAAKDGNTPDLETLIARADQAMYIAKHKGRNRVAASK